MMDLSGTIFDIGSFPIAADITSAVHPGTSADEMLLCFFEAINTFLNTLWWVLGDDRHSRFLG